MMPNRTRPTTDSQPSLFDLDMIGGMSVTVDQPAIVADVEPVHDELADAVARRDIAERLDATLFVAAGAGAGKTTALTQRIVSLVHSGIPITAVAAITFTEKAAADLRRRIRLALAASRDPLAITALEDVDAAAIGTLHAFAARILREFPVDVGLPPTFTVLDEVGSDLAFESRWTGYLEDLFRDESRGRLVMYADADKLRIDGLRDIAMGFGDNWDLVADRVDLEVDPPVTPDYHSVARRILDVCASAQCPDGDSMGKPISELTRAANLLVESDDEFAALQLITEFKFPATGRSGSQAVWRSTPAGATGLLELRERLAELKVDYDALAESFRSAWRPTIGAELGRFTLEAAEQRRAAGELEFHDLLVLARDLVRDRPDIRSRLHSRYQRLLLDEFQDTDPIQLELAVWLAADPTDSQPDDWRDVRPIPGRLFFVGDPKQSIYRFRRADIAQFLAAPEQVGAEQATLDTNFRSTPAVISWVNAVFGQLIVDVPGEQPPYIPLRPVRSEPGSVTMLGREMHRDDPDADELRRREAAEVAATLIDAVETGWPITEEVTLVGDDGIVSTHRIERPCRFGDIAILVPARTSLPALQDALLDAGIPFQAENASLVYATTEVRGLLLALRAIDDTTDELALVSTLRSPLFGCSDRDLYEWRAGGGHWRVDRSQPAEAPDGPVADAMELLRAIADDRHWSTPSELLHRLVESCRVFELALSGPGARDTWRRVRFIIDQARAWSDAGGWGLRNYLHWTRRQGDDGRYVAEAVLPETDLEAVRIMTVHAAKGLEFPIVVLSGLTTKINGPRKSRGPIWPPGTWTLAASEAHEAFKPIDEQLNRYERLRLLYVACTRAEDHLVVSLHRKSELAEPNAPGATLAQLLGLAGGELVVSDPAGITRSGTVEEPRPTAAIDLADFDEWEMATRRAIEKSAAPRVLAATTVAKAFSHADDPGLLKDGVNLELPPWQRGRYGSAVGRAVHGVLQAIDLASGDRLAELAAAQAAAEGILGREGIIVDLARSAIESPIVVLAATRECWRELYVAAPIGDIVIEGYIDLLVRTDAGLVLVDYKTDHVADQDSLDAKVQRYARQMAAYGIALEVVLGEPIVEARLVMCSAGGASEIAIDGWRGVMQRLRAELSVAATSV